MAQTPVEYVPSKKPEGGQVARSFIRLKELGGEYEDEYVCALLGNIALTRFAEGTLVVASLAFKAHQTELACYQSVMATEIASI